MAFTKIDKTDYNGKGVIGLPDAPQLSTTAMQEKFEEISTDVIIPKHNALIDELEAATGASSIGTTNGNVQSDIDSFDGKISSYNTDISNLKTDMTQAKADITTLKADDVTEKADILALQTDNTANKAQINTNKNDITALKADNTTNKANITTLQTDNATNKSNITSLQSSVAVLNSQKHTHTNKTVIDALSKDATTGNLMFEGQPIQGGGGASDVYGHVKVGSVTLNASGDDTLELVAGSNVTLTPNATGKSVTISSSGGGGGTSTGDMLKSEFVLTGGTGQVLSAKEADHATNADNATNATNATNAVNATTAVSATSATTASQVGSATTSVLEGLADSGGKLQYKGSLVNDITVDSTLSTTSTNPIQNAPVATQINAITTKLSKIDTTTTATQGQALAWDTTSSTYKPTTIQGGISPSDMLSTRTAFENNTATGKVVDSLVLKEWSNGYSKFVDFTISSGTNTFNNYTGTISTVLQNASNDANIEFFFELTLKSGSTDEYENLTLSSYKLGTGTDKGRFEVTVVDNVSVDVNCRIKVTEF